MEKDPDGRQGQMR